MLKILIAGTVATSKVKKFWSHISDFLYQKSPYGTLSTVIAHLLELQQEDPMARMIRNELATPNVNVYSGQLGHLWSKGDEVLHYDGKPYIPKSLSADLLVNNHDDLLAEYFKVEKTLEHLRRRNY